MRYNLGKIVLLLFLQFELLAQVSLSVPKSFFQGDSVEFLLKVSGKDIKIPDIDQIDGFAVQSLGRSTQTQIINGVRSDSVINNYSFQPTKEVVIPSFQIQIDGKIEKTKPQKIEMKKVAKTVSQEYDLSISVDKKELFVGESLYFTLVFKYKKDLPIVGLEFEKPKFENFWVKELQSNKALPDDPIYSYQKLEYILFPQKSGKVEIPPLKIVAVLSEDNYRRGFFLQAPTKKEKIYSNNIELQVKSLPENIKLIGDFAIDATVNKTHIKEGEAVSYQVTIQGRGNIDDIDEVSLDIQDATIYENQSKKEYDMKNNSYGGVYTKTFSIVPSQDLTIPSLKLQYFDKKTETIQAIQTKSFPITVEQSEKRTTHLEIQKELQTRDKIAMQPTTQIASKPLEYKEKIAYFLLGVIVGGAIFSLVLFFKKQKKEQKETPLVKMIKKAKTPQELLKIVAVYIKIDKDLDKIIFALEGKLENKEFQVLKKETIKIFKKGLQSDIK